MTLQEAINQVRHHYEADNVLLLQAIEIITANDEVLTEKQRQSAFDAFALMAWDSRFLVDMPHDASNPGMQADIAKRKIYRDKQVKLGVFSTAVDRFLDKSVRRKS